MAVRLEKTIKRFIGLSTDIKPLVGVYFDGNLVEANDIPAGSSFLETDTGKILRFDGANWTHVTPENEQTEYLQAILFELASFREILVESLAID